MYLARAKRDDSLDRLIRRGLLLSLLLHALSFYLLKPRVNKARPEPIMVDLVTALPNKKVLTPQKQIVTEPQSVESKSPPKTRFLAEQNRSTDKETIHRGLSPEAGPVQSKNPGQSRPLQGSAGKSRQKRDKLKFLKLDTETALTEFGLAKKNKPAGQKKEGQQISS
ncbi:MAG: hypothetical protein D6719_09990, partial [Candidatus Dadabacteria bacterium]